MLSLEIVYMTFVRRDESDRKIECFKTRLMHEARTTATVLGFPFRDKRGKGMPRTR